MIIGRISLYNRAHWQLLQQPQRAILEILVKYRSWRAEWCTRQRDGVLAAVLADGLVDTAPDQRRCTLSRREQTAVHAWVVLGANNNVWSTSIPADTYITYRTLIDSITALSLSNILMHVNAFIQSCCSHSPAVGYVYSDIYTVFECSTFIYEIFPLSRNYSSVLVQRK